MDKKIIRTVISLELIPTMLLYHEIYCASTSYLQYLMLVKSIQSPRISIEKLTLIVLCNDIGAMCCSKMLIVSAGILLK